MLQIDTISIEGNFELSVKIKNAVTPREQSLLCEFINMRMSKGTCGQGYLCNIVYNKKGENEGEKKNKCQSKGKL